MTHLLWLALVILLAVPASAQRFEPSVVDITAGGALDSQIACATVTSNIDGPVLLWFDAGTESIWVARNDNGQSVTFEVADAGVIDAAIGHDVEGCRAADYDDDTDILYLVLSSGEIDFVTALDLSGDAFVFEQITTPETGAGDGVVGIALVEGQLYAAVRDDLNDPPSGGAQPLSDGFYRFEPRGADQTASPLALNSDLSLTGLAATATENAPRPGLFALLAISDSDGSAPYTSAVVALNDPTGSPTISVFADPLDGVFSFGRADGRLVDVVSAVESLSVGMNAVDSTEGIFVLGDGPGGVEIARYRPSQAGSVSATEASIVAGAERTSPGFSPAGTSSLHYASNTDIDLASLVLIGSNDGDGLDEVLVATGAFVTPTEPDVVDQPMRARLRVGPNPVRGVSTVEVRLSPDIADVVVVRVVDMLGRVVADLYRGPAAADGSVRAQFNSGTLAAGVYLVRLESATGRVIETATVTVVR